MKSYLVTDSPTRINDRFLSDNSTIRCEAPAVNYKDPIIQGSPNFDFRWQAEFYQKVGVDIVTETVFQYPYPFITEKTYRPMASLRPFIMVGSYHTLDFLKSIGFKTFSSIIDESYDDILDPEKRFKTVCNSIKVFVTKPIEQIQKDLFSIEQILLHNQAHLYQLIDSELKKFQQVLNDTN